mmetsp:Transcript_1224/g.1556  ORF Transcript_1224/g.1556 Transcript_1224/m.1556 type:complete len:300 (-) Transcript_1224:164-1063(-)|eukprot:jgi/Bigna1/89690/estExt_fgenesh1_pg.C_530120
MKRVRRDGPSSWDECGSHSSHLPPWITTLKSKTRGGVLYLIGTSHVEKSEGRIQEAIEILKPRMVMLELCKKRKHVLSSDSKSRQFASPSSYCGTCRNMCQMSLSGHGGVALLAFLLSQFLQKGAEATNRKPGQEFREAAVEARKQRASLILGDRDFTITMQRMWAMLSTLDRLALCWLLFLVTFVMRNGKNPVSPDKSIRLLGRRFPGLRNALVNERDDYMAHVLRYFVDQGNPVVAVVGEAHVAGICNSWEKDIDVQKLLWVPQRSRCADLAFLSSIITAVVIFAAILARIFSLLLF